ncbi:hypothetical protein K7X08_021288 [Anisodus acutangulus]|uniref:Uncharacterized protein n=1 Tax=Anisodus acutangulus TaxID=402998 RepID=A0A9Q1LZ42_9SOLA|nr:hypothetical protein K7X08_021288 [Anisodus acutangulus]
MPASLLTCSQLRHLTLQNCSILYEQDFKGVDRLISLELRDVTISSKLLERSISRACCSSSWCCRSQFFAAGAGEVPMRLSYDLCYVKYLCISSIYLSDPNEVSYALCLIRSFPFLQSMEIKVESDDNDIPALESLEVERLSDVTFNYLKEVELKNTWHNSGDAACEASVGQVSPELVSMLIEPCLVEESATVKILAKLIKFQRASPKAEVVYKLDKHPNRRSV